jgi:tetratricopeptide (TPR) repeat protein
MRTSKPMDSNVYKTLFVLGGAFLFGIVAAALAVGLRSDAGPSWAAVLWAMAFTAIGFAVGFLFAVPRSASTNPSGTTSHLQVNTNLEQISDWLTKAITGVALASLKELPADIQNGSYFVAQSLGGCFSEPCKSGGDFTSIAGAIFSFFLALGFLGGYVATRTFFTRLFVDSDATLDDKVESLSATDKTALSQAPVSFEQPSLTFDSAAEKAADALQAAPLSDDATPEALSLLGKAKLVAGKWSEAVAAYKKSVERLPNDPATLTEYAYALRRTGYAPTEVFNQLEKAEALVRGSIDKNVKRQVYEAATFEALYLPSPDGFEKAIVLGTRYGQDQTNLASGPVWVNLACAYGQKVRWLRSNRPEEDTAPLRAAALNAIKNAVQIDTRWKAQLRSLMEPSEIEAAQGENDLEVFRGDPDFQAALA